MNSINTPFSLMDKFKTLHFSDLGYGYYENYVKGVQDITPDAIQSLAIQYLEKEQFTSIVVGEMA